MRWVLICAVLAACSAAPDSRSSDTTAASSGIVDITAARSTESVPGEPVTPRTDTRSDPVVPSGFDSTTARVTAVDGTTCEICVWLATTSSARARGLMGVTDLGAADAMAFVYDAPHTGSFWMKDTVLPLSIAFFAPGGAYVGAFDMEPCVTETCTSYATPTDFLIAVEVPQGELASLGMSDGSTLQLLDRPCLDS